ncbi:MAG: ABC transporter permease [Prevotella sp.]|nr:ABC transporter permease [Prevotella sp.]
MIKYLLQKEFLQIRRNSFMPKIIFIFPIMVMCVMPWVMNQEVKNIRVDVVDIDRTTQSQQLLHQIEHSNYFIFNGQKATYQEALRDIETAQADIILEIRDGRYLIAANAVNGTKGSIGSSYLTQIVAPLSSPHGGKSDSGNSYISSPKERTGGGLLILYNKGQNYKVFMIPALMGILMMMLCGFLPALNIVGEKEKGTIEQINVTPVSKWIFILAKLIPYWLIGLLVLTVCLLLSWAVYGITCQGPLWLVYLLAILLALFFSSFGLIISNYSDTMQQAMLVMWFFVVCLMLLSGLFTPTRSMPSWAYLTTYVNPMHYFIDAIRTVFVRGGTFQHIAYQVYALFAISFFMAFWAVRSYRKNN